MRAFPYPQHIKPLTALRFIAAFWVLLYHFKDHLGLDLGRFGLIADGYLGVDLFFTLSGFILAHVYLADLEAQKFGYGGFLKNRLARVYPMHLAALAAMLVLFAGASALGANVGNPAAFKLSDLPAHLMMIHAWGATEAVGWNFPSWSVSAEWAAYLLFPLIAALALKARPVPILAGALALCLGAYTALDHLHLLLPQVGRDFSQMTAQIGALRILPSFFLGVALYAFARAHAAPPHAAWPITLASAFWIIAVTSFGLWEGLVWFGLAGLIYGLAETSRHGLDAPPEHFPSDTIRSCGVGNAQSQKFRPLPDRKTAHTFSGSGLAGERLVFLGAASYALYMIHLPIDIIWFHALDRVGVTEAAPLALRLAAVAGVFAVSIGVSMLAYLWLEEPARKWIRKVELRAPFRTKPAPQL